MIFKRMIFDNFEEDEFPEDELYYAGKWLFNNLQLQRKIFNRPIYPSKAKGALARFEEKDKYSMHYAVDRESTAIDFFTDVPSFEAWSLILSSGLWDGAGIYFDTKDNTGKPHVMFHVDFGRSNKAYWLRHNNTYSGKSEYINHTDKNFWPTLLNFFFNAA